MRPSSYDKAYYAANGQLGDRPAPRCCVRLVGRYLSPTKVLDVGCGTGHSASGESSLFVLSWES